MGNVHSNCAKPGKTPQKEIKCVQYSEGSPMIYMIDTYGQPAFNIWTRWRSVLPDLPIEGTLDITLLKTISPCCISEEEQKMYCSWLEVAASTTNPVSVTPLMPRAPPSYYSSKPKLLNMMDCDDEQMIACVAQSLIDQARAARVAQAVQSYAPVTMPSPLQASAPIGPDAPLSINTDTGFIKTSPSSSGASIDEKVHEETLARTTVEREELYPNRQLKEYSDKTPIIDKNYTNISTDNIITESRRRQQDNPPAQMYPMQEITGPGNQSWKMRKPYTCTDLFEINKQVGEYRKNPRRSWEMLDKIFHTHQLYGQDILQILHTVFTPAEVVELLRDTQYTGPNPEFKIDEVQNQWDKIRHNYKEMFKQTPDWNTISNIQQGSTESVREYYHRFSQLVKDQSGEKSLFEVPEVAIILIQTFVDGLTKVLKSRLTTQMPHWKTLTMDSVLADLYHHEKNLEGAQKKKEERLMQLQISATERTLKNTGTANKDDNTKGKDFRCFNCNGKGHIARYCKKPKKQQKQEEDKQS
ncbi:uncharacterized protein [Phyllobates terribilis]|uniref:uncharacterized protein n=1 Tax=Phyllobates terribilis TaxID=111132 RepID=UPI003CCAC2C7